VATIKSSHFRGLLAPKVGETCVGTRDRCPTYEWQRFTATRRRIAARDWLRLGPTQV